ncbi:MAG: hypothetical protein K2K97_07400, partial [Muribaculaceae bacterium]|nr:hypothetical protein [Muribaculaceae bacterium]
MSYDSNIRLAQFLKHENIKGTEFAEMIGTSQPTISAILSSKRALSRGMMARTCDVFHQLNFTWLLTGEGDMLKKDPESLQYASLDNSNVMIPLIHIDSVGGVHSENSITSSEQYVERLIPFPDARPGDVAILQSGNSMAPTIPAGAILQIRKVEGWQEYFGYGNDFVLWLTDDRRITK